MKSNKAMTRLVWTSLITLALIGVVSVVGRLAFPADAAARIEPFRAWVLALFAQYDPIAGERAGTIAAFDGSFGAHRVAAALHVASGGLVVLLVPLQLWRGLRTRHPAVHRWLGRVTLGASLPMTMTALYFGLLFPFAGLIEAVGMALGCSWFVLASTRAVLAIRRRDVGTHREWMLRAMAVPLGVSTMRIIGPALELTLVERGLGPRVLFQLTIWIGWAVTLSAAEVWIRTTRPALPAAALPRVRVA